MVEAKEGISFETVYDILLTPGVFIIEFLVFLTIFPDESLDEDIGACREVVGCIFYIDFFLM